MINKSFSKKVILDPWIFITAIVSLFLRSSIPANINVDSPHDDLLGVKIADSLLNGNWLGSWDNTTLLKPPTYSLFLYFSHWLPVETTVFVQFLLLGAFLWFVNIIRKDFTIQERYRSLVPRIIFTLLAFNPILYSASFSRIYRNQIYVVLLCYLLVATLALTKKLTIFNDEVTASGFNFKKLRIVHSTGALVGTLSSLLILTRQESVWLIAPCFLLIFGLTTKNVFKANKEKKSRQLWGKRNYTCFLALIILGATTPIILVRETNRHVYGSALIQNFSSGEFARAINLWSGIAEGQDSRLFIPISAQQRMVVYKISPTAQKLQPYLDNPDPNASPVNFWISFNCSATGVCDNAGGAWFPFQLRDAAVLAGNIKSERDFQEFFREIADDIVLACAKKSINCSTPGFAPGVKNLQTIPKKRLFSDSINVLNTWFSYSPMLDSYINNGNSPDNLKIWHSVIDFKEVHTGHVEAQWKHLQPLLNLLTTIYQHLTVFLFLGCLTFLAKKRNRKDSSEPKIFILVGMGALAIFCFGVGILSSAWGFTALGIYAIPAQPIFLILCSLGCNLLVASNKDSAID
jgi:hypothetical protein